MNREWYIDKGIKKLVRLNFAIDQENCNLEDATNNLRNRFIQADLHPCSFTYQYILGYINFYCKYYGFSIPLDVIEKHNQNFQKLVIIPKDKYILQRLITNAILNLN